MLFKISGKLPPGTSEILSRKENLQRPFREVGCSLERMNAWKRG